MPKMSAREKNLGVLVLVVLAGLFEQRVQKTQSSELLDLQGQVAAARDRMNQSRALMASLPKTTDQNDRRPAASNETTMTMLKDVTVPPEIKDVKVLSIDHPSPAEFRMTVEGRFGGLMKFLSYLERPEGDFRVQHVDIGKPPMEAAKAPAVTSDEGAQPARDLRGSFILVRRS